MVTLQFPRECLSLSIANGKSFLIFNLINLQLYTNENALRYKYLYNIGDRHGIKRVNKGSTEISGKFLSLPITFILVASPNMPTRPNHTHHGISMKTN